MAIAKTLLAEDCKLVDATTREFSAMRFFLPFSPCGRREEQRGA
jgi:hypothetical protein